MIVEMRTYTTNPGCRAKFLEIFRRQSIPAHEEIGMKILGPFLSVEDPDTFFFMRGFPDLASREPMKAKFYESELWRSELEGLLMPMLEKYEVVLVGDPEHIIQWRPAPRTALSRHRDQAGLAPNLCAPLALALAASSSRLLGGAFVSSERRSRVEISATSSTAARNAASFAFDGLLKPLIFRTY